ncbi:hypothetical protein [Archangium lansingense]|uniref:Uncharacterized protein n=1 Tax=Archangium lansingense TaxID=2995310 RepID=A0ABT4AH73_9BACT|nr:hypothetical protein [Archangium lansinium]MCY1080539.1 hypothetical protein [Archangium lansinium]
MPFTPDLLFHETMSGPMALGSRNPEHPARHSRTTRLSLHATIRIDSMEDFLLDPEHVAWLGGHLSFPPFSKCIPIRQGRFQLFSPSDDPLMRLMHYDALFEHEERTYCLSGTKFLRDDPGPDLWTDTTRLHTTLHEGHDTQGPVVGAGVLTVGVRELLALVASMRSPRGGSQTLARFGQFFLSNLWELYA